MSNFPPNPFVNAAEVPHMNAYPAQQMNHNQPTVNQPNYSGLKQDANSNSPVHAQSSSSLGNPPMGHLPNMNNFNQSSNSSPAFNRAGMVPGPPTAMPPSMLSPSKQLTATTAGSSPLLNSAPLHAPLASSSPRPASNANNSSPYPPNFTSQGRQINDNAPPLIPSSQAFDQPLMNRPPMSGPIPPSSNPSQYPPSSRAFSPMGVTAQTSAPSAVNPPYSTQPNLTQPSGPAMSQPNIPFSGPPLSAVQKNSPIIPGPHISGPARHSTMSIPKIPDGINGASSSVPPMGPPSNVPSMGPSTNATLGGPPMSRGPIMNGPPGAGLQASAFSKPMSPLITSNISGPLPTQGLPPSGPIMAQPTGFQSGPQMGPPQTVMNFPPMGPASLPPTGLQSGPSGMQSGPPGRQSGPSGMQSGPPGLQSGPMLRQPNMPSLLGGSTSGPQTAPPLGPPMGPQAGFQSGQQGFSSSHGLQSGPQGLQSGPAMGPQSLPPMGRPSTGMPPTGVPPNPPTSNMQNRYPQMPQPNFNNAGMQPPNPQYNTQAVTQQMGNLSVTKQGFDQLWGHQNLDLMQIRHIMPEYPEEPPEIRLGQQFAESSNCSPEIFRCTVNRIPETNNLLQKSRLPLGILIHPFKDLNHLPVIQCASIVRCRACRTYINPFVYFLDSKRWKCNLCFRVNDLPEEFQYDPVSKSYGDPSRRPEIKSATIEFIAPGEYMLRPPQPAVYLFLMDVSQLARESNYMDVLCKTLKSCLDQLPGDARTQVGFICYDAQIHYYLMSDGLTRPKEMTVIDIDDVFLPSPESLLVNLGERRELISELLSVLPKRYSAPGTPASALGAALQAALKLMSPTGGRITVFQTCLPNVGPGALQPREDPNARSSKDVAHLNPATDFYKRLALDCSGAQISVDLFLLNSQYSDLATLSGMSKFSAGSVYHIPLFSAARGWQAEQLRRLLVRYFTRKIGFEAVMRVRCTRGVTIHTFHGNFFVRSTDLLSLPNCSPDAGFGMQLAIEESLTDMQHVCFQAALLYTSSKGERRIRVHTLALPIATTLPDVLHSADQQCIVGLLSKMAVDRCASASMSEAREALINVAVDALSAHRLAQNLPLPTAGSSLFAPASLRLLPVYLLALLKRKAFRTGTSTRLDDRVADMCELKTSPLPALLRRVYPDLYPLHCLESEEELPRLSLTAEKINSTGAYLLDDGETMIIYVCHAVSPALLSDMFGVTSFSQIPDEARTLPSFESDGNEALHAFIDHLNDDRPYPSNLLMLRDNSPSRHLFTERLIQDRVESAFSYYEFLEHVKNQVK